MQSFQVVGSGKSSLTTKCKSQTRLAFQVHTGLRQTISRAVRTRRANAPCERAVRMRRANAPCANAPCERAVREPEHALVRSRAPRSFQGVVRSARAGRMRAMCRIMRPGTLNAGRGASQTSHRTRRRVDGSSLGRRHACGGTPPVSRSTATPSPPAAEAWEQASAVVYRRQATAGREIRRGLAAVELIRRLSH